jgi:hypothetical protein
MGNVKLRGEVEKLTGKIISSRRICATVMLPRKDLEA